MNRDEVTSHPATHRRKSSRYRRARSRSVWVPSFECLEERVALDAASTDNVTGIHSRALALTGLNIVIGQVEIGRPGKHGFDGDPATPPDNTHPHVNPAAVHSVSGPANAN